MKTQQLHGTSAAARLIGVCEETLRKYVDDGIVKAMRDSNGRRLFSDADVATAKRYRASRSRGPKYALAEDSK
jgi:DNA-binding transcriptional MerR regulator